MSVADNVQRISLQHGAIVIDGTPTLVLCSSLFYFRIPRGLWRERLRAVRAAGYNCIDVYTPWNYHESAQGEWDFDGERDVAAFFQMAAEEGLWVLARPGPYICSEWDGGALPAYLFTDREMRLRDNDPRYLSHVARWYDQILPIIRRFQLGADGTVIAVQLENELDFYDCEDPRGYQEALRDMALQHGIAVPLVACAGQGDIERATGATPGIVPSCNFYPNDRDPAIEARVAPYWAMLNAQGLPLMVTETNRAHFLLRRLLSAGAKLLGPYLQTSGFDFGFTNATNNWGDPLAFMTSDYDFGGMIGPYGELRPEVGEARILSTMIAALGPALATAPPTTDHGITVTTALPLVEGGPRALALEGGGLLLALPNVTTARGSVQLRYKDRALPVHTSYSIAPEHCPFVLFDLPLAQWEAGAAIAYATAELIGLQLGGEQALLAFCGPGEVELVVPGVSEVEATGIVVQRAGERVTLCVDAAERGTASIRLASGKQLRVLAFGRELAATMLRLDAAGEPVFAEEQPSASTALAFPSQPIAQWSALALDDAGQSLGGVATPPQTTPLRLEEAGIGRGFGWYTATIDLPEAEVASEFLVHEAADVVSLYWGERYQATVVPGGGTAAVTTSAPAERIQLTVRAEIWGHSNFDDAQLPGLRLAAMKGLSGITAVTSQRAISSNWLWYPGVEPGAPIPPPEQRSYSAPVVAWGSGQTARTPDKSLYLKQVALSPSADTWVLRFKGLQALVRVWVNDQPCGIVSPRDPYVDITAYVSPGGIASIALHVERWHSEPAGQVTLLEGRRATNWSVCGGGEALLWSAASQVAAQGSASAVPYRLAPGGVAWLFTTVDQLAGDSWTMHYAGQNAKLTAFFNGHGVGRIWLPSAGRPQLRGGDSQVLYLPAPWFQPADNLVAILVEAIDRDQDAEITEVVVRRQSSTAAATVA